MIIDAHTHILPPEFKREKERVIRADDTFGTIFADGRGKIATADDLAASMRRSGVTVSVAAGYGWTDAGVAREANDYSLDAARRSTEPIIPFCSVNPLWGEKAAFEVRRCAEAGARGLGELHPDTQGFSTRDEKVLRRLAPVMDAARLHSMPVLVHASEPVGHSYPGKGTFTPEKALAIVQAYPENIFIFAHFGGGLPFYALMPEVGQALRNVYFDSAAQRFLYRPAAYPVSAQTAGCGSVLFGSDYPLVPQRRALLAARSAGLGPHVEQQVIGQNAARLFRLV
jgi:hypothetical protein